MSVTDDLVPKRLVALVAQEPPALQLVPSPLPQLAFTWYVSGGCWSLALALHAATGLPIEIFHWVDGPRHAYIVDGDYAIDARGRNLLRLARAGAARLDQVNGIDQLVAMTKDVAPELRTLLDAVDVRSCAARAAAVILAAVWD